MPEIQGIEGRGTREVDDVDAGVRRIFRVLSLEVAFTGK
jgi:hypothetical protein